MTRPACLACISALMLCHCVGPYDMPPPPFGPGNPAPYTDAREQYRGDARDYMREQGTAAYETGARDGAADRAAGETRSYLRHPQHYDDSARTAYQQGYDAGYGLRNDVDQPPPFPAPAPANDAGYSQGYDYGLRDRVAGRPADPDAHIGKYDPRLRRGFERGYYEAYESPRPRY